MKGKRARHSVVMAILVVLFLALLGPPSRAGGEVTFLPMLMHARPRPSLNIPSPTPYIAREGDTLFTLAHRFHRPLHQMTCALPASRDAGAPLTPGLVLYIPPERSVCHVVGEGQTLAMLARAYGVTVADIVAMPQNELRAPPYRVAPGQRLLIPVPPDVEARPWVFGDGHFRWPVEGVVSQFWSRAHPALDIAADEGTLVVAADTGVVAWAGWDTTGYGWLVVVDHGNGYRTYYAHLKSVWVSRGERVIKGQPIGRVGSTGHSTGPHLHFEIRDYGVRADPLRLLPER